MIAKADRFATAEWRGEARLPDNNCKQGGAGTARVEAGFDELAHGELGTLVATEVDGIGRATRSQSDHRDGGAAASDTQVHHCHHAADRLHARIDRTSDEEDTATTPRQEQEAG